MTILSAPVYQFPKAEEIIQGLVTDLRFLREFPDHSRIGAIMAQNRRQALSVVEKAQREMPEFLALAQLEVAKQYEHADELYDHPEECDNCHGVGRFQFPGSRWETSCNCPLGQAMERGRTLAQDRFDRGLTQYEPAEDVGQFRLFAGATA